MTKFNPAAIGPAQIKTAERLAPNHRANLQAGWTYGDFGVNVVERYYGTWSAEADYPGQEFGAKFTTDLDFRYTFAEKYTLTRAPATCSMSARTRSPSQRPIRCSRSWAALRTVRCIREWRSLRDQWDLLVRVLRVNFD